MPRRPARHRLTACACMLVATAAAGVLLAPAASAGPEREGVGPAREGVGPARDTVLPLDRLVKSSSNAPNHVADVPPFGRKL